ASARVREDPSRDVGVRGVEFDRDDLRLGGGRGHPQRAVTAVGPELQDPLRARAGQHVASELLLAAVTRLPVNEQLPLGCEEHPEDGPAQKRQLLLPAWAGPGLSCHLPLYASPPAWLQAGVSPALTARPRPWPAPRRPRWWRPPCSRSGRPR